MLSVTPKSKKISNMIFLLYIQVGTSPSVMVFDDMEMNYDKRTEWVSPSFSNEVFERSGVEKVKKLSSEGEITNWLWLPGVLPRAIARHDRRVLCFSSNRSGRLCRYPIPWGKTGPCFSFFVKMSAFVDVDGGLLMSSTRVGNVIWFFWLPCWILLGNTSWKNVLWGIALSPSPPSQIQATFQPGRGSSFPPDLGNARK